MKRFFRSLIYGGSGDQPPDAEPIEKRDAGPAPSPESGSVRVSPAHNFTLDEILTDLLAHICTTMSDPPTPDEVDLQLHMFDAGYLTSITAADLIAHIDARYGIDISETQLIGPLQNLAALVRYVESGGSH